MLTVCVRGMCESMILNKLLAASLADNLQNNGCLSMIIYKIIAGEASRIVHIPSVYLCRFNAINDNPRFTVHAYMHCHSCSITYIITHRVLISNLQLCGYEEIMTKIMMKPTR